MTTSAPVVALEILSASVWIGSLVSLAVVSQAARKVLEGPAHAALFRAVRRRYAIVGTASLLVAIGDGLVEATVGLAVSLGVDGEVHASDPDRSGDGEGSPSLVHL